MKIRPIFSEKSMKEAKEGKYSFWVLPALTKNQIKTFFEKVYKVKIRLTKTMNYKKRITRNMRGRLIGKPAMKKAILVLKSGKIDIFDSKTSSKEGLKK